jgi:hypothetical protein
MQRRWWNQQQQQQQQQARPRQQVLTAMPLHPHLPLLCNQHSTNRRNSCSWLLLLLLMELVLAWTRLRSGTQR